MDKALTGALILLSAAPLQAYVICGKYGGCQPVSTPRPEKPEGGSAAPTQPSGPSPAYEAWWSRVKKAQRTFGAEARKQLATLTVPAGTASMRRSQLSSRAGTAFFGLGGATETTLFPTADVRSAVSRSAAGQLAQTVAILALRSQAGSDDDQAFLAEEAGRALAGGDVRVIVPGISAHKESDIEAIRVQLLAQADAEHELVSALRDQQFNIGWYEQQTAEEEGRRPPGPEGPLPKLDFNAVMPDVRKRVDEAEAAREEKRKKWEILIQRHPKPKKKPVPPPPPPEL